jgi:hypothetical protein
MGRNASFGRRTRAADAYEVDVYLRVEARLDSGWEAWVYVDARGKPPLT